MPSPEMAALFGEEGTPDQKKRIQRVREAAKGFAQVIDESAREGGARSQAFRYIHEASLSATKAILEEKP